MMHGRVTISAAMIVKNEARFLPGCLDSLAGRVDEIVVVDTGSTDGTIEIAEQAGVHLLHQAWRGDFAGPRNFGLDHVRTGWVLYIDADERLGLPRGGRLADYIDPVAVAGFVRFRPKTNFTRYREWRLFRADRRIRFAGMIHETAVPAIKAVGRLEGWPVVQTDVEIDHLGYDGDISHKHPRNLALLEQALPGDPDRLFYWHHLAETYAGLGRWEEAEKAARQGLERAEGQDDDNRSATASLLHQFLVRSELRQGRDPTGLIASALAREPDDYALHFLKGHALLVIGQAEEALEVAQFLRGIDPDRLPDGWLAFDRALFADKACELAALACLDLGRHTEAGGYFAEASRLAPGVLAYRVKAAAFGGIVPVDQ
ncbi:glycosyltransferase [Labrys sp. LIt4]|uniref:glycosyltransferase n=1 Tax=Labrys sp. LIt4 TaxID=2821355 RepID=UPI001ADFDDEA|nr:glycosyltransferase [Labrys sp. LIt4]MBP0581851.1 glycosyltransferase [Labrys sp. LIt4]